MNETRDGTVHHSPIQILRWCGYSATWDKHKNKGKPNTFTAIAQCMGWFHESGYILDFNEKRFQRDNHEISRLNTEMFRPDGNFGILYDFEIQRIMDCHISYRPLTKSIVLLVLSYIRAYTWIRQSDISGHSPTSMKEKPEIFYSQYTLMGTFIGVAPRMISKAVDILADLGLLISHRLPNYKTVSNEWRTNDVIFVCPYKIQTANDELIVLDGSSYDYKKELENGIAFLRSDGYAAKKFYQS